MFQGTICPTSQAQWEAEVQGYLAHKKLPPPLGPPYGPRHMLLQVPKGGRFLMSEVPLYREITHGNRLTSNVGLGFLLC